MKKEEIAQKMNLLKEKLEELQRDKRPRSRLMRKNHLGRIKGYKQEIIDLSKKHNI